MAEQSQELHLPRAGRLGDPDNIRELREIADRHGIPLVEDAAQAFGARYRGRMVGGVGWASDTWANQKAKFAKSIKEGAPRPQMPIAMTLALGSIRRL